MILLLMQSPRSEACRAELEQRNGRPVTLCTSVRDAVQLARANEYEALVLDQNAMDLTPGHSDTLSRHAGTAVTILINPAIWGIDRTCREVEFALERARNEKHLAEQSARNELKEQFSGAVTGILLSSELALTVEALPPPVEEKLKSVRDLALQMSRWLRLPAATTSS
ncbi:MAG TPA: hypothetical protein VNW97_19405 [Candidatus Saccharimonadales bacterium]|jgi:hypothetical protein|nr:hypothetical protein [Candidatus Saccharimonadales bacterium]